MGEDPDQIGSVHITTAKSYIGQYVNLHLKDSSTVPCLKLLRIENRVLICEDSSKKTHKHPLSSIKEITRFDVWHSKIPHQNGDFNL